VAEEGSGADTRVRANRPTGDIFPELSGTHGSEQRTEHMALAEAYRVEEPEEPQPSAVLVVFLLVVTGSTVHWGAFKWHALLLMMAAAGWAVFVHLRPRFRVCPADALLLGALIAFLAMICCMPAGQAETKVPYLLEWGGWRLPKERVNGFGMAIHFLASASLILALTYLVRAWDVQRLARWRFLALVAMAVACRPLILMSSPSPKIDVFTSQTAGAKGLLIQVAPRDERESLVEQYAANADEARTLRESRNVYAMVFPSPYWDTARGGPRLDEKGRRAPGAWFDHYGYPPATVYANALSWWAFKDVRAGWVLCDLVGALCLYLVACRMSPGDAGRREMVTLCFLFLPRTLFVLEQSWTEPLIVATMGVFVVLLCRSAHGAWSGTWLGLWLSSKQYVVLAAPMVLKYRRCKWWVWGIAIAIGAVLIAPFALWDWNALYHDVLGFFFTSDIRPDALSLVAAAQRFGHDVPWWVVLPLWCATVAFYTATMRRTLSGMLFSTASTWLTFFLLGKQAFMNYWYVILFVLLMSVAASRKEYSTCPAEAKPAATPPASPAVHGQI